MDAHSRVHPARVAQAAQQIQPHAVYPHTPQIQPQDAFAETNNRLKELTDAIRNISSDSRQEAKN